MDPLGKYPGQLGFAANNKTPEGGNFNDALEQFGFSMWVKVFVDGAYSNSALGLGFQGGEKLGDHGDINLELVPLPAALPLYGTGLAILGLMGWRNRRKTLAASTIPKFGATER